MQAIYGIDLAFTAALLVAGVFSGPAPATKKILKPFLAGSHGATGCVDYRQEALLTTSITGHIPDLSN